MAPDDYWHIGSADLHHSRQESRATVVGDHASWFRLERCDEHADDGTLQRIGRTFGEAFWKSKA